MFVRDKNPLVVPVHTRLGSLVGSWLWPHHMCNADVDWLVGGHGHLVGKEWLRVCNHGAIMVAMGTHFPAIRQQNIAK